MINIDLNADLGEACGNDKEIMKFISSANIACGLHAGSSSIMAETVKLALANNVSIGAHPGYPDRENFGRIAISMPFDELMALLLYQIGALYAIVLAEGGKLNHVKAHGALYNSGARNIEIARAIVSASKFVDPKLIIFGPFGSLIEKEAISQNMKFSAEVFADRAYSSDGSLVPRSEPDALIEDTEQCASRTLNMITKSYVISNTGDKIDISADTVCLHGDNKKAIKFAKHLHKTLIKNNINIISRQKSE